MPRLLALLMLLLASALLPGSAAALESTSVVSKRATVTLVSDTDALSPGAPFRAALRFRLTEGWHTYWKNPGDAGVAPELSFTLPNGVTAGPIDWPTPRRVAEGPVMTYAYTHAVLLPVTISGATTGLTLKAHANWLVCKDICVPEEGDFTLALPAGTAAPNAQAALFAEHDRQVPRPALWRATIAADGSLFVRDADLKPGMVEDAWFIPDAAERIQDNAAQPLSVRSDGFVLSLKLAAGFRPEQGLSGVLSVRDRAGQQTDMLLTAEEGAPPAPDTPLPNMLLFAFLGGLILNLMPCVFPILAMKAVGLAAGLAHGKARAHALAYTLGVLVTFAGLAAALLAARALGSVAGWGFQFQSPPFVAGMAWLLFGVGLNLSGVFQIGGAVAGMGSQLAMKGGSAGSFFTGLLAVLVATPCTAPFMGVAIAAGLAAPPPVTILVFLMMGMGLAAPYIALAFVPGLGRLLPRPGKWMETLKQGLAFPMYGGAVWLLWVVSQEAGSAGVLITAAGCVLLSFAGWVLGVSQNSRRHRRFGQAVAVAALLCASGLLVGLGVAPPAAAEAAATDTETFTADRLFALRQEGRPVFVNMTAAWCVTCLVNERVAIRTDAVRQAFAAGHVAYLKGDWTRQDPEITAFLRRNGRDGVPLYLFYKAGGAEPVMLPQILTESTVLAALGR
jgi:thiol:disulfide interchange protein DsbD